MRGIYYSFVSFFSSFTSFFGSASFLDKLSLPFLSYPVAFTRISSPTDTTSLGFSTLSLASCDTCTRPSQPSFLFLLL